MTEGAQKTER